MKRRFHLLEIVVGLLMPDALIFNFSDLLGSWHYFTETGVITSKRGGAENTLLITDVCIKTTRWTYNYQTYQDERSQSSVRVVAFDISVLFSVRLIYQSSQKNPVVTMTWMLARTVFPSWKVVNHGNADMTRTLHNIMISNKACQEM